MLGIVAVRLAARLAVGLAIVFYRIFFAIFGLVQLRLLLDAHIELGQHAAGAGGVGGLVVRHIGQHGQLGGEQGWQIVLPPAQIFAQFGWRRDAGQRLASQQAQHLGHRDILMLCRLIVALLVVAIEQRMVEVDADAGQDPRAQRLHPRLLQRLEGGAGFFFQRLAPGVDGFIVKAQAQGRRIGRPPDQRDIAAIEIAWHRDACFMAGQPRRLGRKLDLNIVAVGDRAQHGGGGLLEDIGGGLRGHRVLTNKIIIATPSFQNKK